MADEAAQTQDQGQEGQEAVTGVETSEGWDDPAYGDPPYPDLDTEEGAEEAGEPAGGAPASSEGSDPGKAGPGESEEGEAGEKPPKTQGAEGQESEGDSDLPDPDPSEYLARAAAGEDASPEQLAELAQKQRQALGEKGTEIAQYRAEIDNLRQEIAQLKATGAPGTGEPSAIQGGSKELSKRASEQVTRELGEKPDPLDDPEAARAWDDRYQDVRSDLREQQRSERVRKEQATASRVNDWLVQTFPDAGPRSAFINAVDPILEEAGIDAPQLTPRLLSTIMRGINFDQAVKQARLDGRKDILSLREGAQAAGTNIAATKGGGRPPATAGGDTVEKLRADVHAGKIDGDEYLRRLQSLKDSGLVE